MMKQIISTAFVALSLVGCATYKPVPDNYTGPIATITDSGISEDMSKAQMFVLAEIDGNAIRTSINASANRSHGLGMMLITDYVSRQVPVKPMKVKLKATHQTGAPIHELFSRATGSFFSVEGVVDFTPIPNGNYVVKGELKETGSSVWIEDASTKQRVTEKIVRQ